MYGSLKWLEQCLEYELKTKIHQEKLFCSWLFAYAKSWAAINWEKYLFLHLCAPIFSSARLPRNNCFNWWMGSKWLLFSFLTLCLSLSPFINWFDLLTRLDTTPESLMLSEDHFSRGCFKSHSVWLAKITFFTGRGCAESVGPEQRGRGGQKFVPAVKKLYELQIFNFLRRWKVSRLKLCLNDLDRQSRWSQFVFVSEASQRLSIDDYWKLESNLVSAVNHNPSPFERISSSSRSLRMSLPACSLPPHQQPDLNWGALISWTLTRPQTQNSKISSSDIASLMLLDKITLEFYSLS